MGCSPVLFFGKRKRVFGVPRSRACVRYRRIRSETTLVERQRRVLYQHGVKPHGQVNTKLRAEGPVYSCSEIELNPSMSK
jgi:hypothetical protein